MIKDWIRILGILLLTGFLVAGCSEDDLALMTNVGDKEVMVTLPFGSKAHDEVHVTTRGTYDLHYESMVRNMYVFLFADGKKVYGRYFDDDDLDQTGNKEYWEVQNMSSDGSTDQTSGTLHICVPAVSGAGAEIVLIANIDLDFMNMSQDRLGLVRTKSGLESLIVSLNQEIPERNAGYFMMTGSKSGVIIADDGKINIPDGKIMLQRLDAKVEVNVRVNPNEESKRQKVEMFTPESWQVVNLPKSSYLTPNDKALHLNEDAYFNISPQNFETTENEKVNGTATGAVLHGFSFYTLENKRSGEKKKSTNGNFHERERRNKYADGTYNNEDGMWEYAPEMATYIIVKGELQMVVDPGQTSEQHLIADVTYYVHLGNFASDKDNYDVARNTHYKYTINIKGVDNIEVEVETSNDNLAGITENQPGAMGHLYEAEEDTYTFDAHYGQRVYTIKASEVDVENMTWYVRTPFGREGIPAKDDLGNEIYNDLDYKWVEFMLNDKIQGTNRYAGANKPYPADKSKLMYVIDMLSMVKTEYQTWKDGGESLFDENGEMKFTVFVNEFYYDVNPMNPNDQDILWKKFVNQPNRLMHILCKNNRSADDDSSVTGSILTIRQRSIQTPFNISLAKTSLTTGWGCETEDETKNQAWFYHPDERMGNLTTAMKPSYTPDNISRSDGLYNTACLINLVKGTGNNKSISTSIRWDTFVDYSGEELKLKAEYLSGMRSVYLRNRDLDGDGIVDPEELRWYIASLEQLCGLFLGDQGLSSDAQLYPVSTSREPNTPISGGVFNGCYPWRLHVTSSTAWNQTAGNSPTIVWAEEGASTGEYQEHWSKPGYSPVRCVRNLGMDNATADNIKTEGGNFPKDKLVKVTKPTNITLNSVYKFDFTNMNEESRRYYTTRELAPGDEYTVMSRLYDGFETGEFKNINMSYSANNGLKYQLENGLSPSPTGYRVPNVREGVVMYLYCQDGSVWWDNGKGTSVSNYYSFGYYGNQYDKQYNNGTYSHFYSWTVFKDRVTVGDNTNSFVRFVKDIQPNE